MARRTLTCGISHARMASWKAGADVAAGWNAQCRDRRSDRMSVAPRHVGGQPSGSQSVREMVMWRPPATVSKAHGPAWFRSAEIGDMTR